MNKKLATPVLLLILLGLIVSACAAPVVVLRKSGHRGAIAMIALQMTGYTDVRNLGGGTNAWAAATLPVIK